MGCQSCRFEVAIVQLCQKDQADQSRSKTASDFSEIAATELDSLAQHMPNLSDIDARTLALRIPSHSSM